MKSPISQQNQNYRNLDVIDPGHDAIFNQIFTVPETAEPFSKAYLQLEMLLSQPWTNADSYMPNVFQPSPGLRRIAWFDPVTQISGTYRFNPRASYLMVVNTTTPGSLVRALMNFVEQTLGLAIDVYNISVTGSLIVSGEVESVLQKYSGKTVILLSNTFDYFGLGQRIVWDFINPGLARALLKAGTTFLLLGLGNYETLLYGWGKSVATPHSLSHPSNSTNTHAHADPKAFLAKPSFHLRDDIHAVTVKKGFLRSQRGSTKSSGTRVANKLRKLHPGTKYVVSVGPPSTDKKEPETLYIREGLSSTERILASTVPCDKEMTVLWPIFEYLVVAAMPFDKRCKLMWDDFMDSALVLDTAHEEDENTEQEDLMLLKSNLKENAKVRHMTCDTIDTLKPPY